MRKIAAFIPVVFAVMCGCSDRPATTVATANQDASVFTREVSNQIAYIQLDSLLNQYEMFIELSTALEEKATKAENEITAKGRSLERSMMDAQEKVEKGLVTRAQAAELQEKLQRQEQSFYQYRERMQQELMEENQVMMNNLYHNLNSFLEEFNADYRYGMILTTTSGTPIIHADPALDITDIVVRGLNDRYATEKRNNK